MIQRRYTITQKLNLVETINCLTNVWIGEDGEDGEPITIRAVCALSKIVDHSIVHCSIRCVCIVGRCVGGDGIVDCSIVCIGGECIVDVGVVEG